MNRSAGFSNRTSDCRMFAVWMSAWVVGMTVWAGGLAGLLMF